MIVNSMKLNWAFERKGKNCIKHFTRGSKYKEKQPKKQTPKSVKNLHEMGRYII